MESTRAHAANVQITGLLDMRNNQVVGLDTNLERYPWTDDQATTKIYVDTVRNEIVDNLPKKADNGVF